MRIERVSRHFSFRATSTWADGLENVAWSHNDKAPGRVPPAYGVDCGNRSPYSIGSLAA
jgi:hypothetical protein